MEQQSNVPGQLIAPDCVAFPSAEEAWIWAVKGMSFRLEGGHMLAGMGEVERPCEASDVINCAARLRRSGRLTHSEISVLFLYGLHNVPPRALGRRHAKAAEIWDKALTSLANVLEQKGIIQPRREREVSHG